jgi:hypothetical protein
MAAINQKFATAVPAQPGWTVACRDGESKWDEIVVAWLITYQNGEPDVVPLTAFGKAERFSQLRFNGEEQ